MVVIPHSGKDYPKGNKQSCSDLVEYLEKENEGKELDKKEHFFNSTDKYVNHRTAIEQIDGNVKGLKKNETKFFMLSINPSQRELNHLARMASGKSINDISEFTPAELEKFNGYIKDYTNNVMELYASGFNKGLTAKDLVYFAKVEQERHYTYKDEVLSNKVDALKSEGKDLNTVLKELGNERQQDVRFFYNNGAVTEGQTKIGLQTHVHIVVSRRDKNMKVSISPLANSRGKSKHYLNGKEVKVGFDRDEFKQKSETLFDNQFNYQREYNEYYSYSKSNQQTFSISSHQVNNFIKNYQNKTKNSAVQDKDLGDKEVNRGVGLIRAMSGNDPNRAVQSILNMGKMDNLNQGDLGRMNQGQYFKFLDTLSKGNPVSIAKSALQLGKDMLHLEL